MLLIGRDARFIVLSMLRFCLAVAVTFCAQVAAADVVGIVRVIDGDTFDVSGTRVRLFGIDAPEQAQKCQTKQGADWACGAWVTSEASVLFNGKRAICAERDIDRYGRVVATCTIGGRDAGRLLVDLGLAEAYRKYSMMYDLAEKQAVVANRGLHAYMMQSPSQFRKTSVKGRIPPNRSCAIKGNISASGRIYHVQGQVDYQRTRINERKGERWFCNERDARASGWRKARR